MKTIKVLACPINYARLKKIKNYILNIKNYKQYLISVA